MKHNFSLFSNHRQYALLKSNGTTVAVFDKEIYNNLSLVKVVVINTAKQYAKNNFDSKDSFSIKDETELEHSICSNCGSTEVEVKAWVNENTGMVNPVEDPDNEDTWCPVCGGHHGITMETKNYELYNSEAK